MNRHTRISLVRHGTVHNPADIFYGRLPGFGLSAAGRIEAAGSARALGRQKIAAVFSSPLLRARQTARAISAEHPQADLHLSRLLLEVHTVFEGGPLRKVHARKDDVYTGAPPQFEQPEDICRRAQKFMLSVRRRFAGRHTVAVTHGDVIVFALLHAAGLPLTPANKRKLLSLGIADPYPAPGSITTFLYLTDSPDERPGFNYLRPQ